MASKKLSKDTIKTPEEVYGIKTEATSASTVRSAPGPDNADGVESMPVDTEDTISNAAKKKEEMNFSIADEPDKEMSAVEKSAAEGKLNIIDDKGQTVEMSQGAAKRFAIFDADGNGYFDKAEVDAIKSQIKKNNQTVGLKDMSNGPIRLTDGNDMRLDFFVDDARKKASRGKKYESIQLGPDGEDGVITVSKSNKNHNHYEGVLGSFDYDPKKWAFGYKTVYDSIGGESVSTEIPIMRYIGNVNSGDKNNNAIVPEGLKSLDYSFEGLTNMRFAGPVPSSVESMHCAYKDCVNLEGLNRVAEGRKESFFCHIWPGNWGDGIAVGSIIKETDRGSSNLPDNVKDLSYCFSGCTSLTDAYKNTGAGTQLENMDGYARGCGKLTTVLDVSQAKFLPVSAQTDAYDGINTRMIRSIGGVAVSDKDAEGVKSENGVLKFNDEYRGISMYANEGSIYASGKNETVPYSVDESERLKYVKAVQDYRANDRMYLADPSAVANATAGMATTATYLDENGQVVHTTDPTKENKVEEEGKGGLLGGLFGGKGGLGGLLGGGAGQIIQRLGFGFLEYKLFKGIFKNPLVALGITAGGQALGILPGTIGGLGKTISTVGGLLGKDSKIGGMLTKVGDKMSSLDGGSSSDKDKVLTKEEASNMNMIKDADQAHEALSNTMSKESLSKLNDNMAKRGDYSAEYGTFQKTAEVQEGYGVLNNVRMASEDAMAGFAVAILKKEKADGGQLSDESKNELAVSAKQILQSWSTYGEAASDSLRRNYGGDPEKQAKGEAGLGKMMRAAVTPDIEIIKGLNDRYQFLSEGDIQQLDNLQFKGLEGVTFSNYQPGMNYAPAVDKYVPKVDEKGKPVEGVFQDYAPQAYDIEDFVTKAGQKSDRAYRTETYVSSFGDGASFAKEHATGGVGEVAVTDITRASGKPSKQLGVPPVSGSEKDSAAKPAPEVETAAVVKQPSKKLAANTEASAEKPAPKTGKTHDISHDERVAMTNRLPLSESFDNNGPAKEV